MIPNRRLIVGVSTPTIRPLFVRTALLQMRVQTLRPDYHAIFANGPDGFDVRIIEDLLGEGVLYAHEQRKFTSLAAHTQALKMLRAQGVDIYFCMDDDDIYRRDYIQSILSYLQSSDLDLVDDYFCLNLINQQWLSLYENGDVSLENRSFEQGLGLGEVDKKLGVVVGAPPTNVFSRKTVDLLIDVAERAGPPKDSSSDRFWRRALAENGIKIRQVETPRPVFAYLRHSHNTCWGGKPAPRPKDISGVSSKVAAPAPSASLTAAMAAKESGNGAHNTAGHAAVAPTFMKATNPTAAPRVAQVSVIIPTYNEGHWLKRTVDSILEAKCDVDYEIVVVDDGCDDGSIDSVRGLPAVACTSSGGKQLGAVISRNRGAEIAKGKYLCFLDSHVLVHDRWLDHLKETCDADPNRSIVTGNLPNVNKKPSEGKVQQKQFGYTLKNWLLQTSWHSYGQGWAHKPYSTPLAPGGLMFMTTWLFHDRGGFEPWLRKWGREDTEFSLRNYCRGGYSIADHRVYVYHYYKKLSDRTFAHNYKDSYFNALFVAKTYFPDELFCRVRDALAREGKIDDILAEVNGPEAASRIQSLRSSFTRTFADWSREFEIELAPLFKPTEIATAAIADA